MFRKWEKLAAVACLGLFYADIASKCVIVRDDSRAFMKAIMASRRKPDSE